VFWCVVGDASLGEQGQGQTEADLAGSCGQANPDRGPQHQLVRLSGSLLISVMERVGCSRSENTPCNELPLRRNREKPFFSISSTSPLPDSMVSGLADIHFSGSGCCWAGIAYRGVVVSGRCAGNQNMVFGSGWRLAGLAREHASLAAELWVTRANYSRLRQWRSFNHSARSEYLSLVPDVDRCRCPFPFIKRCL